MNFYYLSGSPFSWKVWLALEHRGFQYQQHILSADAGDLKAETFLSKNPHGKVPVIEEDGLVLYESSAIIDYLAEKGGEKGPALWPADIRNRAVARRLCAEADNYIYPHVRRLVVEFLSGKVSPDQEAIQSAKLDLGAELPRMFGKQSGKFLIGDQLSGSDFALYPLFAILRRIDGRKPEAELRSLIAAFNPDWSVRMDELPIVGKTWPPHWGSSR